MKTQQVKWLLFWIPAVLFVLLQGEKQKYWDNIVFCVFGRVPDSHHLYPFSHFLINCETYFPFEKRVAKGEQRSHHYMLLLIDSPFKYLFWTTEFV